jgi:hypothetical protein
MLSGVEHRPRLVEAALDFSGTAKDRSGYNEKGNRESDGAGNELTYLSGAVYGATEALSSTCVTTRVTHDYANKLGMEGWWQPTRTTPSDAGFCRAKERPNLDGP